MSDAPAAHDLLPWLLQRYYDAPGDGPVDAAALSSHWRQYGRECQVQTDAEGRIVSLTGSGFGSVHTSGKTAILEKLCIRTHQLLLGPSAPRRVAWRVCRELLQTGGFSQTMDTYRQACTAGLLLPIVEQRLGDGERLVVIGDGFGLFSAIWKRLRPKAKIVLIDLGRTLLFQAYYLQHAFPDATHRLVTDADDSADFVYCPADQLDLASRFQYDLAVNVVSMQEMTPAIVADYFTFLRAHLRPDNLFYCCNREHKELPGGEVNEIRKLGYPLDSGAHNM